MVDVNATVSVRPRAPRRGITILEVLFATVVAVVGILGIASLLPLAARNARDSNSFNFVQGAAPGWFQELSTRGINLFGPQEPRWRALQDFAPGPLLVELNRGGTAPSNSVVTARQINRIWNQQSICLDPYFFTEPDVQKSIRNIPTVSTMGAYRPAVFPYYQDGYNPVTDSFAPADHWEDQPRMVRVSIDAPTLPSNPFRQVSRHYVETLFTAGDDFVEFVADEKETSFPATRVFSGIRPSAPAVPNFGKAISERKYSWLATLTPRVDPVPTIAATQSEYSVSIVVFQKRDMKWLIPGDTGVGISENKPSGERLVWVVPLSGNFVGGNGGRVRLISSAANSDRLYIGDWILLGKHFDAVSLLDRFAYFKWYRIVATDAEPTIGPLSGVSPTGDPYDRSLTAPVWSREVVLEGPDFNFGSPIISRSAPPSTIIVPTTGTLMSNVITVIDRTVEVP